MSDLVLFGGNIPENSLEYFRKFVSWWHSIMHLHIIVLVFVTCFRLTQPDCLFSFKDYHDCPLVSILSSNTTKFLWNVFCTMKPTTVGKWVWENIVTYFTSNAIFWQMQKLSCVVVWDVISLLFLILLQDKNLTGENNTVVNGYTTYRHLQQYCS